jgi:hypothetical protein
MDEACLANGRHKWKTGLLVAYLLGPGKPAVRRMKITETDR